MENNTSVLYYNSGFIICMFYLNRLNAIITEVSRVLNGT